jgi:hypothetical protein
MNGMRNLPHSSAQIKHASAMSVQNIPATIQKIMTSFRPYFAKIKQVPEPLPMHSTPLAAINDFLVIEDLQERLTAVLERSRHRATLNRSFESIPIVYSVANPMSGLWLT